MTPIASRAAKAVLTLLALLAAARDAIGVMQRHPVGAVA